MYKIDWLWRHNYMKMNEYFILYFKEINGLNKGNRKGVPIGGLRVSWRKAKSDQQWKNCRLARRRGGWWRWYHGGGIWRKCWKKGRGKSWTWKWWRLNDKRWQWFGGRGGPNDCWWWVGGNERREGKTTEIQEIVNSFIPVSFVWKK